MTAGPSFSSPFCEIFASRRPRLRSRRILVVDDYAASADSVCMLFDAYGFEVKVSYGGISAIEVAREWCPAVIFLDIAMPDMSGVTVALQLKSLSETAEIILVAYTAEFASVEIALIRDVGFDAYCMIPADPSDLLAIANHFVQADVTPV